MNPSVVLSIMLFGTGLAAYLIPESVFLSNWNTSKFIRWPEFLYIVYAVIAFCLGGFLVTFFLPRTPFPNGDSVLKVLRLPWNGLRVIFYVSIAVTLLAYAIWLKVCLDSGLSLTELQAGLSGEAGATYDIRTSGETLPGVTTCTQFEMGVFILGTVLGFKLGWKRSRFTIVMPLLAVLFLAYLRSRLWSERLAVLEIAVPFVILSVRLMATLSWNLASRIAMAVAPVVAPVIVFCFFSVAEYSRSWVTYYSESQDSFLLFAFLRLVGYYVTAVNNGAAFVRVLHHYPIPFHTLDWFWRFPLVRDLYPYKAVANAEPWDDYHDLLAQMANPEFNNPSGIFVVRLDYGYIGGLFAWFGLGIVAMLLYRSFVRGSIVGLLLYPFFFIGLLESPRVLYWTSGRTFPTWCLLFLVLVLVVFWAHVQKARPVREGLFRRSSARRTFPSSPSAQKPEPECLPGLSP